MDRKWVQLLIMVLAAALEVGGDAMIRAGFRRGGWVLVAVGFVTLGSYGVVVTQLPLDFSKLLGVYVGVFAIIGVAFGRLFFGDVVGLWTWVGLAVVLAGSAIIQFGQAH
jgi:drug/metabolite transporter superfamily protein YnfA